MATGSTASSSRRRLAAVLGAVSGGAAVSPEPAARSFTPSSTERDPRTARGAGNGAGEPPLTAQQIAFFQTFGFLTLRDYLRPAELAAVQREFAAGLARKDKDDLIAGARLQLNWSNLDEHSPTIQVPTILPTVALSCHLDVTAFHRPSPPPTAVPCARGCSKTGRDSTALHSSSSAPTQSASTATATSTLGTAHRGKRHGRQASTALMAFSLPVLVCSHCRSVPSLVCLPFTAVLSVFHRLSLPFSASKTAGQQAPGRRA